MEHDKTTRDSILSWGIISPYPYDVLYTESVASIIYQIKNVICNETDHDTKK